MSKYGKAPYILLCVALMAIIAVVAATAAHTADYNIISGDRNHNWTNDGRHNNTPPCSKSRPCTRDIRGGDKDDKIIGRAGWDWMAGEKGHDWIIGDSGMDQAYGGAGNDRINLGAGHDHAWGNDGDDRIDVSDGVDEKGNVEEINGGDGFDTCVIDRAPGDAVVNCEKIIRKSLN